MTTELIQISEIEQLGVGISALAKSTSHHHQKTLLAYSQNAALPGHGSPGSDCGQEIEMYCNHCGRSFYAKSSCMQRECPDCYEKWASKEGDIASYRFWTAAQLLYSDSPVRKLHVVVSFPDRGEDLDRLRDMVRLVLKRHELVGGLVIPHPFRLSDDRKFIPDGYVHFHCICLAPGDIKPGTKNEPFSALFKVVPDPGTGPLHGRPAEYRGFYHRSEVKHCIQYLLTHCGLIKGKHAITWFGCLSYNSLSNAKLEAFDPSAWYEVHNYQSNRVCPYCGSSDTEPCMATDRTEYRDTRTFRLHPPPQ